MADVLLHVGTHKTATSTIQNVFFANRARLAAAGLIYPAIGRTPGHHSLATPWVRLPPVYQLPGGARPLWQRLAKDYADLPGTLFLSSEEFSRGQPGSCVDFAELRAHLGGFGRVRVVCTLRDQLSYLQSIYLQVARHNVPPPWPQFLTEALDSGMASGLFLDFNGLLDHLLSGVAPSEIVFVDYASACAGPGGVLGHYLRAAGCTAGVDTLELVEGGASNVSPEPLAAWAAGLIATPAPVSADLIALATDALRQEVGAGRRSTIYTRAEEQRVLDRFEAPNRAFSARLAPVQPDFALTPGKPQPDRVHREDIQASFWLRLARHLHAAA